MARRKRFGLGIVFVTGFLALLSSIAAVYFKWSELHTPNSAQVLTIIFTNVELCTAVIVSCVPSLASLYTGVVAKSLFYSRLRSTVSRSLGLYRNNSAQSGPTPSDSDRDVCLPNPATGGRMPIESNASYQAKGRWVQMSDLESQR